MIEAIINGLDDPKVLSLMTKGRMKSKKEQLERALYGLIRRHQKMVLSAQLKHIDFLNQQIALLDREIAERMSPFEGDLELLDTITGIGLTSTQEIIAETGTDMNRFPTEAHISSWAGMSPGVGHSILVIIYHMLKKRMPYIELGANYFD
jgi:transposase